MAIKQATILPARAARILQEAASTTGTDLQRRKAVDQAIERVKREYPTFFKVELIHGDTGCGQ